MYIWVPIEHPSRQVWANMKQRCLNPNNPKYAYYGGRGISICERWLTPIEGFKNFCLDMGDRPSMKHTLDRIDSAEGYFKENCQWLPWTENCKKRRYNKKPESREMKPYVRKRVLLALGIKKCCGCKFFKWTSEFPLNRSIACGFNGLCRVCNYENMKKHRTRRLAFSES